MTMPSKPHQSRCTHQYTAIRAAGGQWVVGIDFSTMTDNCGVRGIDHLQWDWRLRSVHILLGHTNMESTVRHLRADVEDALNLAKGREI